jgi:hypothetical protein
MKIISHGRNSTGEELLGKVSTFQVSPYVLVPLFVGGVSRTPTQGREGSCHESATGGIVLMVQEKNFNPPAELHPWALPRPGGLPGGWTGGELS